MPKVLQPAALSVSVILTVKDAITAIDFYKRAFGALERTKTNYQNTDLIRYAELVMGESTIIVRDEAPQEQRHNDECLSPQNLGGSSVLMFVYFDDPAAALEIAVKAGAKVIEPLVTAELGTSYCVLKDPFGYQWMCASQPKDTRREEHHKWPRIDLG